MEPLFGSLLPSLALLFSLLFWRARGGPGFRWSIDGRACGGGARGVLFTLSTQIICLVDDEAFMRPFNDSSFDLTLALLTTRRTQNVNWSEAACVEWFPFRCAEYAVDALKTSRSSAENEY